MRRFSRPAFRNPTPTGSSDRKTSATWSLDSTIQSKINGKKCRLSKNHTYLLACSLYFKSRTCVCDSQDFDFPILALSSSLVYLLHCDTGFPSSRKPPMREASLQCSQASGMELFTVQIYYNL